MLLQKNQWQVCPVCLFDWQELHYFGQCLISYLLTTTCETWDACSRRLLQYIKPTSWTLATYFSRSTQLICILICSSDGRVGRSWTTLGEVVRFDSSGSGHFRNKAFRDCTFYPWVTVRTCYYRAVDHLQGGEVFAITRKISLVQACTTLTTHHGSSVASEDYRIELLKNCSAMGIA